MPVVTNRKKAKRGSASPLNAAQAKELLEANAALLVKKVVEEKKPLSPPEIALISAVAADTGVVWAHNQLELAKLLEVDRRTILRWMKIKGNPGHRSDGRFSVVEWRAWRTARSNESGGLDALDTPDLNQTQLKAENLVLQNERLRFQIGVLKRDYWPAEQVEMWGANLGTQIRKVITQLHLAAADLVGCTVVECEEILKRKEDEMLDQLHTLSDEMQEWKSAAGEEEEEK